MTIDVVSTYKSQQSYEGEGHLLGRESSSNITCLKHNGALQEIVEEFARNFRSPEILNEILCQ